MNMNDMPFFGNGGNGGGSSADWKDIQNKPFGDTLVEKEYIFERGNVTTLNGTNAYWLSCDDFNNDSLVAGQGYSIYYTTQSPKGNSVVWKEYTPTTGEKFIAEIDENGVVYLGSSSVSGGYPFYFSSEFCAVNYMWVNQFTYAQGFKLVGLSAETKKLDEKYLPDNVQADWSQNNTTAKDYIKNRTHYRELKYGTMIEETTVYCSPDVEPYIDNVPPLIAGQKYDVVWDGVKYKLTAFELYGGVALGNQSIIDDNEGTDEPFFLGTVEGNMLMYFANSEGEHTLSLSGYHEYIKKIDNEFLPTAITVGDMDGDYTPDKLFFKGRGYSFGKNDIKYEDGLLKLAHIPLITTEYGETYIETTDSIPNLNETVSITTTNEDIIKAIYDCYSGHHFLRAKVSFGGGETTYTIDFLIGQMWYSNPSTNTDSHITGMTCAIDGGIYTFQASFNNNRTSVTVEVKRVI